MGAEKFHKRFSGVTETNISCERDKIIVPQKCQNVKFVAIRCVLSSSKFTKTRFRQTAV